MPGIPVVTVYYSVLAAALGLVMGSFLNCFAYRYANGESVIKGRSYCALCGHTLTARDLIPVLSWLLLRGKCRYCGGKIAVRYVLAELVCATAFLSVFLRFGVSLETIRGFILVSLLFAAAATDLYCGLIPDRLVIIGIVTALVFAIIPPMGGLRTLLLTLLNGVSVALPILIIVLIFDKLMKRETMGGGDIKLLFMIGLFFDWRLNILIVVLACICGLLLAALMRSRGERELPFGPALAISAFIMTLFGRSILAWYISLITLSLS